VAYLGARRANTERYSVEKPAAVTSRPQEAEMSWKNKVRYARRLHPWLDLHGAAVAQLPRDRLTLLKADANLSHGRKSGCFEH
jgi:hypothetical protein